MLHLGDGLHYAAEAVKILGGFASFYAVVKLRQIERRYLFKATIPQMVEKIQRSLDGLNLCLTNPSHHTTEIAEALNVLFVDVKNIKRKAAGDSHLASVRLLKLIDATRPRRYFWQAVPPMEPKRKELLHIWGQGMGLLRSLENDVEDQNWSGR